MDNLESILTTHLSAQRIPINLISESCCDASFSTRPVIDFDAVKIRFCSKRHLHLPVQLKSADCLHIDESKNAICFIEMKNIQNFISSNIHLHSDSTTYMAAFNKWLRKKTLDLKIKIIDSIFIITAAAGKYSSGTPDVSRILDRKDVEISYIVLTNIDNDEYLEYSIASLESKISYPLLTGPLFNAITVISSDFEDFITRRMGTLRS